MSVWRASQPRNRLYCKWIYMKGIYVKTVLVTGDIFLSRSWKSPGCMLVSSKKVQFHTKLNVESTDILSYSDFVQLSLSLFLSLKIHIISRHWDRTSTALLHLWLRYTIGYCQITGDTKIDNLIQQFRIDVKQKGQEE